MNSSLSHPLIQPNSNQYFLEKKYVSIHSEDRDIVKFPNAAQFEIMLPQDYLNIASARLYSWSFPANYNVFSISTYNIVLTFKMTTTLYNPSDHASVPDNVLVAIYAALLFNIDKEYLLSIEPGFYNPEQMATELTNKMNEAITTTILVFLNENQAVYPEAYSLFQQYNRFQCVYNAVAQKLWFGNTADAFILTNDSAVFVKRYVVDANCARKSMLPEWANWGLPAYLGFTRCNVTAQSGQEFVDENPGQGATYIVSVNGELVPRFSYGSAIDGAGDDGFWLLPSLPGAIVYFLQAPLKISFMGQAYIYMEVEGMNCIDETSPWNLSTFTAHTNGTNGTTNSSFAKIAVPTTPISQWFDCEMGPYKYWNPPAERWRNLKLKFRYHNGMLVEFGQFDFSFMMEFTLLRPQQERSYSIRGASDLSQYQPM